MTLSYPTTKKSAYRRWSMLLVGRTRGGCFSTECAALPASAVGKARRYALGLWKKLTEFLKHPTLELSNNLAENSMRPVALGRKNWLHIGSPHAGPKIAAILSVVEGCRRLGISARTFLAQILPGISNRSISPALWSYAFRLG